MTPTLVRDLHAMLNWVDEEPGVWCVKCFKVVFLGCFSPSLSLYFWFVFGWLFLPSSVGGPSVPRSWPLVSSGWLNRFRGCDVRVGKDDDE